MYSAPEIILSKTEHICLSPELKKADIFSTGYLLWYLWKIKDPHAGMDNSSLIKEMHTCYERNIPPISLANEIPWSKLILNCWNYDVMSRPSVEEIIQSIVTYTGRY